MPSPIKRQNSRTSLDSAFEGPKVSPSPSNPMSAPKSHFAKSICKMMKSALQLDRGTLSRSVHGIESKFTITQDEAYSYKIAYEDFDPDVVFPELVELQSTLQDLLQAPMTPSQEAAFEDYILESLTRMVYGSNIIEHAGCGLDITWKLCMAIFRGESIPDDIEERDKEYQMIKEERIRANLPVGSSAILRSRREIIQHAKAAAHMITAVCLHDQDLSEELILETHRILTYKVDAESAHWQQYSGVYRSVDVSAGFNTFAPPTSVPRKMKDMIHQLDMDLDQALKQGFIDPIALAAKYTHLFVNIHPFLDGNGRMCRLILNSLLLKFGNLIVCLGEHDHERNTYLEVASAASQLEATYDGREEDEKPVMHSELASLVLSYAKKSLEKLTQAVGK